MAQISARVRSAGSGRLVSFLGPHNVSQPKVNAGVRRITVCHVISGDLWGGAEAQAAALMAKSVNAVDVCAITFNRGELLSRLEGAGIRVELADERHLGLAHLVRCVHAMLKRWRPDVVHVHGFKENLIAGIAARRLRIHIIRTHHGRGMIGVRWLHTWVERLNAAYLADGLISVSRELAEFLRRNGISLKHLHVIRNGIELSAAEMNAPASEFRESPGLQSFTVGTVGRLVGVKNHRCLLRAFRLVLDQIDNARLVIVGDGPLAGELKSLAAELGISERVLFAGFQRNVDSYIRALDVFVLSSLHEGVPISLLEAMGLGIPVVCTRVGGIPEVIAHNQNGLLVESDDATSLAAAVVKIAADKAFAHTLVENARLSLTNELSFENSLAGTISLYRETVSK